MVLALRLALGLRGVAAPEDHHGGACRLADRLERDA
jgi:hypothetical protein